jgi:acyl-CoA synthetase (AMP-forming)/AMP-acid ligase II
MLSAITGVKVHRWPSKRCFFCTPSDPREGAGCWPAPEATDNMNTSKVGRLGLSNSEEDALVSFMQQVPETMHLSTEPLPRNSNGKVLKRELRERLLEEIAAAE